MKLIVATSGGPDSQALLHWLVKRGDTVIAVGIDHGLRPEAARELDLAERLARDLRVPFIRQSVTVAKGNVLAEARKARYAALTAIADKHAAKIATGHTATDQLETVLLQLVRSDGVSAAKGMRARDGRVVRPLLGWTREQTRAYCDDNAIAYADDPSNATRARGRLRRDVLPVLKALNPRIERSITRWAEARHDDERLLQLAAARLLAQTRADMPLGSIAAPLVKQTLIDAAKPLRTRALKSWLRDHAIIPSRRLLDRLERALTRTQARLTASEATFYVDATLLWVVPKETYDMALTVPGEACVPNSRLRIAAQLDQAPRGEYGGSLDRAPTKVAFDADDLQFDLRVRSWSAGDRIVPFGRGNGSVKIGDLFTNTKVPRAMRPGWPVVVHGTEIVWVVGLRRSNLAPITPRTSRVITLEVLR